LDHTLAYADDARHVIHDTRRRTRQRAGAPGVRRPQGAADSGSVLVPGPQQNLTSRVVVVVHQVSRSVVELALVLIGEIGSLQRNAEVTVDVVLQGSVEIEGSIEAVGAGAHLRSGNLGQVAAAIGPGDAEAPSRIFVVK